MALSASATRASRTILNGAARRLLDAGYRNCERCDRRGWIKDKRGAWRACPDCIGAGVRR